ncbi:hypothetical protein [Snodgrassella alvi]|nr:hypothetical protein [Snodgrassella alvi]PIT58734.1 hypothetical protein BHC49_00940 [Snodgrassella alvi]
MAKEIRFFASVLSCYTENDVLTIGIGNDPILPDRYLIISRFDDGEIDDSIGIQTYISEIEVANAIENIVLKKNSFTIDIKKKKENEVCARKIIINFDNIDTNLLVKYINEIFLNSSVKVIINI